MKTVNRIFKAVAILAMPLLFANCGSGGGGSSTPTYSYVNGQCVQTGTNNVVPITSCPGYNGINGPYGAQGRIVNGQCLSPQNQVLPMQYCQGGVGGIGGFPGGVGGYPGYGPQYISCVGIPVAGYGVCSYPGQCTGLQLMWQGQQVICAQ